jgi:hypothetical protein
MFGRVGSCFVVGPPQAVTKKDMTQFHLPRAVVAIVLRLIRYTVTTYIPRYIEDQDSYIFR